ncbi:hypothetical protein CURTO8I2_60161 [Curtobacterium sp. 8I-2]|nr:hypothetical protein CURTO8I2_60161 [Curtobacterium sp. 8I-2]
MTLFVIRPPARGIPHPKFNERRLSIHFLKSNDSSPERCLPSEDAYEAIPPETSLGAHMS